MLRKFNFGQQLWHKLWCYWGYLEEHIGNLVNMLGMSLQTCGNILRTWREQLFEHHTLTPLVYKGKEPGLLRCMLSHFIGCTKILFTKLFVTIFGLGYYPFLKAWIPTYYFVWVCRYTSFFNWGVHPTFFFFFLGEVERSHFDWSIRLFFWKHWAHPPNRSPEVIDFIALVIHYLIIMVGTG